MKIKANALDAQNSAGNPHVRFIKRRILALWLSVGDDYDDTRRSRRWCMLWRRVRRKLGGKLGLLSSDGCGNFAAGESDGGVDACESDGGVDASRRG